MIHGYVYQHSRRDFVEHIKNLVDLNKFKENQKEKSSIDEKTRELIKFLFKELKDIFYEAPNRWKTQEDFLNAKRQWFTAFIENNINTIEQLTHGLKQCRARNSNFIPIVGQFISWCKPTADDLGLLHPFLAYGAAIKLNSPYGTPDTMTKIQEMIIRHAIGNTGSYELKTLPESKSRPIFERNYDIAIKQYLAGELKEIPKAIVDQHVDDIEQRKRDKVTMETYKCIKTPVDHLNTMRSMLKQPMKHPENAV